MSFMFEKTLVFSIICSKCKNEEEKIFKEKESIEILEILALIQNVPPGNKTSWRRRSDVSLHVPATSQVGLK